MDKDAIKRDRGFFEQELKKLGAKLKGKACRCLFHEEKNASAGIFEHEHDGVWLYKCQVCDFTGDVFSVIAKATGRDVGDVLRELCNDERQQPKPTKRSKPRSEEKTVYATLDALNSAIRHRAKTYTYTNPTSQAVEMIVLRIEPPDEPKQFLQASPVAGGFVLEAPPKPWPVYNRSRIASTDTVIVCEGEKAVHALAEIGIVATTSPGGAGKASLADWSPLAGKLVYLWPDNDLPDKEGKIRGVEHMKDVAQQLQSLDPPARLRWIDALNYSLPAKGDVVEYLQLYGDNTVETKRAAIFDAMRDAQGIGGVQDLQQRLEATIAGERKSIPFPWPLLGRLSKALTPGTVTIVAGDPGSTKSFLMLEAAAYWHNNGVKIAIYELEDTRADHLNRVLAQLDHNSNLTDSDWVAANPEETRAAFERHREWLEGFDQSLHVISDAQMMLPDIRRCCEKSAKAEKRITIIDPVTSAAVSDKPWIDDRQFLMDVKQIACEYGCSIILVSHPRKGRKPSSAALDDLAGGSAYSRFAHNVFWVIRHDKPRKVEIRTQHGNFTTDINRTIRIAKARNGKGAGAEIGYVFDAKTLRFSEQGVISKVKRTSDVKEDIEVASSGVTQSASDAEVDLF